ncbi:Non-histone chromosomal protein 6 [Coemansia thaxteri]|uniref:Non-histone chromosomal protein 6 n=1 Tax=Coemansia thaxteri TaxID=2663907 RepID=A0A9W8EFA4_9FUNG|nr:Non-histone chromosomal protein 6 [Coemansia thaxteri]KAJ2003298.1 Non-histone chromosomal protein 6 [Coemansia thaxteri]KAJ2468237.1 Non-histone chromosomal protein 6 [Coemansia sp. RSA 2322]KAJ2484029.1 Non-histone chromosomal protein 6 [Coemansia sp. RSA 2320]
MARSAPTKVAKASTAAVKTGKVTKASGRGSKVSAVEKEPKTKRGKKKDKTGPKRALSAYMFFSKDMRKTVQEENPDVSFGQIGRLLGDRWKGLNETEKAPYNARSEEDKQRFAREKANHVDEASESSD